MNNNIQKYELSQNGRKYILITQVQDQLVLLKCIELGVVNPPMFFGGFTLAQLGQLCSKFNTLSSINEAHALVGETIEKEKVGVEPIGDVINIILYFPSDKESEEFEMKIGLSTKNELVQQSTTNNVIQKTTIQEKVLPVENHNLSASAQVELPRNTFPNIPIKPVNDNAISTQQTTTKQNIYQINQVNPVTTGSYNFQQYNKTTTVYNTDSTSKYQKLKLSLSPSRLINTIHYESQQYNAIASPKREQIQFDQPSSPSKTQITYSLAPSHNTLIQQLELLKTENNKLKEEIAQLKSQNNILLEENKLLRQNQGGKLNENLIHENEKLRKEFEKYINIEKTFEEYKGLKEEEIKLMKLQIEELLKNRNSLSIQQKNATSESLKGQTLTVKDSRVEIVKGDIIENTEELELLTRKICRNHKKVILDLLYKATIDSDTAAAFHNKCDWADKTLVLIKSGNGKRFGGYTSVSWKGNCCEKKDENAFVFSLDKLQTFDVNPSEDAIGCYPKYGPVFLGCQIRIYDQFFTKGGTTFERGLNYNTQEDYELSGGLKIYDVKELEVYSVRLE